MGKKVGHKGNREVPIAPEGAQSSDISVPVILGNFRGSPNPKRLYKPKGTPKE